MRLFASFRLLGLLGAILLLSTCKKENSGCEPYVAPIPADTYNFPIRPGTPAWASFKTGTEMVAACQLPAATLQSISTPGLLTTCLNYPLLADMLLATSLQRGARGVLDGFNGFAELRQRPQAAVLLLECYQLMRAACLPKTDRGAYTLFFSYFEMIITQDEYLAQLSSAQRHALVREALTKYSEKEALGSAVYGGTGPQTTAFIMARVMQAEQYSPFIAAVASDTDMQLFVAAAETLKPQTLGTIISYAKQFN